jgi:hypothetical protein
MIQSDRLAELGLVTVPTQFLTDLLRADFKIGFFRFHTRARICKRLWSPRIDSKESIPPVYVACRAVRQIRLSYWLARLHGWRSRFVGIDSYAP